MLNDLKMLLGAAVAAASLSVCSPRVAVGAAGDDPGLPASGDMEADVVRA